MSSVKLQLLLRAEKRSEADRQAAADAARAIGLELTGAGAASLSARIDEAGFRRLFGHVPAPRTGTADWGGRDERLPVPAGLQPYVSNISVAPDHIHF